MRFTFDYNKPQNANEIVWGVNINIEETEVFIDYIRCDDGEDYQFLQSDKKDFTTVKIHNFEAIASNTQKNNFFLCYTAEIEFDIEKNEKFKSALENSDNQIEAVLGFKKDGKVLEYCFEEYENKTTELVEGTSV